MEVEYEIGVANDNLQNIDYTKMEIVEDEEAFDSARMIVDKPLVSAQEIINEAPNDSAQEIADSAPEHKASHALPPMAAADLEMNKKTLVLDLDDTLMHANAHPDKGFDFSFEFTTGKAKKFYILKRPGVEKMLQELSDLYEIVIFTAAEERYANTVLEEIDPEGKIKHRLSRKNCTRLRCNIFLKDLSMLGRDLKNVIFVDDKPFQCLQTENAYPISPFIDDVSDTALYALVDFCKRVASSTSDVRDELQELSLATSAPPRGVLPDVDTAGKKMLVLGRLEGLLVHSTSECLPFYDFTLEVYPCMSLQKGTRHVLKRPGVDMLVAELAEHFEIVAVSSDDDRAYMHFFHAVLDRLDPSRTVFRPSHRLFQRDFMTWREGPSCRNISMLGRDLRNVIFVDVALTDSCQYPNVYPVSEFEGDMRDKTLFQLIRFCKGVADATSDVRAKILFRSPAPPRMKSPTWVKCTSRSGSKKKHYFNMVTAVSTCRKPRRWISQETYSALWRLCTDNDGQNCLCNLITKEKHLVQW